MVGQLIYETYITRHGYVAHFGNPDFPIFYRAAVAMVRGGQPYGVGEFPFVYPPSALLLLAPVALVPFKTASAVFTVLQAACIASSAVICMRGLGQPLRSSQTAIAVAGSFAFIATFSTLWTGNPEAPLLLGESLFLYLASRRRWAWSGLALGLTLALKPTMVLVAIVPAVYRRFPSVLLAIAVPVGLSGVSLALSARAAGYFDRAIPFLLSGEGGKVVGNDSISGTARLVHADPAAPFLVVLLLGLVAWALLPHLRHPREDAATIYVMASLTVLVMCLALFSTLHYPLMVLPLLYTVVKRDSPMRSWTAWVAVAVLGSPDLELWRHGRLIAGTQLRETVGLIMLLVISCLWLRHEPRLRPDAARQGLHQ